MIKSINLNNIKEVTELFIECFNNPPWNDKWDYLTASRRLTDIANTQVILECHIIKKKNLLEL